MEYSRGEGEIEARVDGFIVDVRLPDELVEIQTSRLGKLRTKLEKLANHHRIRLVHPVPASKIIAHVDARSNELARRRSPKRGRLEDAFGEIADIASVLLNRNITLEIALVDVTEYRHADGKGSWRRRGISIVGRRLDMIVSRKEFRTGADYVALLPEELGREFTNRDLGDITGWRYPAVQAITRALRKMGLLAIAGKRERAFLYRRA